jgi:hyaluronan synthase
MIARSRNFMLGPVASWLDVVFQLSLYIILVAILFSITILKTHTAEYFFQSPFLYGYTIFVTLFRLSRVGGALFYRYSDNRILSVREKDFFEPSITFVVPCKNEEDAIYKTVSKCFESDYPSEKLEVIVVNDGSTDGTMNVLRKAEAQFPGLTIIDWSVNQGKRFAMAEGFRKAKGDLIIQLDSDSYIDPKTLRHLVSYFNNSEVGAVCAHAYIENSDKNLLTRMQASHYYIAFRISKAAESAFNMVFCCSGCSSAYRKDIILPILDDWLNETFLGLPITWGDDRALTNWVIKLGYKTIYTDKSRAWTIAPEKWKQFIKQQIRWKKGWFVNSIIASKFIIKKDPFIAFSYFLPLTLTTLIAPFIAIKIFWYDWIVHGVEPFFYITGALLINCLLVVYYRILNPKDKYWWYTFLWTFVNMFFLTYILFYALATIQNRKWGTR